MSELVTAATFVERIEAELAQGLLEAGGVEAMVDADDGGATSPFLLTGAGGARLLVRAEDAERAAALLQAPPQSAPDGGN